MTGGLSRVLVFDDNDANRLQGKSTLVDEDHDVVLGIPDGAL